MKNVDLYVRVSTDEQADKGYSLRHQEEVLRRYCSQNNLTIRRLIIEDYSAKTFNRPEWNRYIAEAKKSKSNSDAILFIKWDRFSRNIAEAYGMIALLNKLGIDPQAIEQPLDMSVPENKIILAVYLASPEVENDRRALNVISGQRRALKEGRHMNLAPVGYCNKSNENGRKYICPKFPEADIIKWAFNVIARDSPPVEQVYKMAKQRGLKCCKNNFWWILRNPIYYGKIIVPKYKNEPMALVDGQHEPIVSERLFFDVQDVLNGKKKKIRPKLIVDEIFPLRGFVACPVCDKILTASSSKGRNAYYHYYHCYKKCTYRAKASDVHNAFQAELDKYSPRPGIIDVFKDLLYEAYANKSSTDLAAKGNAEKAIEDKRKKINKALNLLMADAIDAADYKNIKEKCEEEIRELERQSNPSNESVRELNLLLGKACNTLTNISLLYSEGSISVKRGLIGSIFPEKIVFEKNIVRTARVNEAARLIFNVGKAFNEKKIGQTDKKINLSKVVIEIDQ